MFNFERRGEVKKIMLLCIAISLISISSWSQNPIDIKGWSNTTWGMTEENLLQIFDGKIIDTKDKSSHDGIYSNLKLTMFNIEDVYFDVYFEMGEKDNRLRSVRLACDFAAPTYYSQFEQLLTDKYGQPSTKDKSQNEWETKKNASWLLPSTKIELKLITNNAGLGSNLNILYRDIKFTIESLDKL